MKQIRGLDGVRAVAILPVTLLHFDLDRLPGGYLGVDVFFVVSGYLITTQLLRQDWTVASFLWRRMARLAPALLVLCAFAGGITVAQGLSPWPVVFAATFVQTPARFLGAQFNAFIGPTWSLAVEMQFYVLWALFMTRARNMPRRRVALVAAGGAALSVLARIAISIGLQDGELAYYSTPPRLYAILAGCLLALLPAAPVLVRLLPVTGAACAWFAVQGHWFLGKTGAGVVATAFAAGLVTACVDQPGSRLVAVLDHPVLRWVGTRSYSLYLWQFCAFSVDPTPGADDVRLAALKLALLLALTEGSYRFVEVPARRWLTSRTPAAARPERLADRLSSTA